MKKHQQAVEEVHEKQYEIFGMVKQLKEKKEEDKLI